MFEEFWEKFHARPSMFVGGASLQKLEGFVNGMVTYQQLGLKSLNNIYARFNEVIDFDEVEKFINKKYNKGTQIKSFALALILCKQDDQKAFYKWLTWLKEYQDSLDADRVAIVTGMLKKAYTKQLLSWLRIARISIEKRFYFYGGNDEFNCRPDGLGTEKYIYATFNEIKKELATREHVPNKQEAKKIRQQKAKRR